MNSSKEKNIRIAFLQAPLGRREPLVYPLGIVTLASALRPDIPIKILDPNLTGIAEVTSELKAFDPQLIGISIRNIDSQLQRDLFYYYLHFQSFIREIRKLFPHACIVLGGAGFSLFPKQIMDMNPQADVGVYLEADECFSELLDHLSKPSEVKGVFYRTYDGVVFTGDRSLPVIETSRRVRYELFDPRPYSKMGGVGVQTKRGCPLKCAYCTYPLLNGACFRLRPVNTVIEEIRVLYETFTIKEISFVDGIFNQPKERSVEILEKLISLRFDIKWRGWFTETGFDRDFAKLCQQSGCREFSFSPDGFSDKTLESLGKAITHNDIERIFSLFHDLEGARVAFNFFWNPPDQEYRSFLRMILFAFRCKRVLKSKSGGIIFGNPRIEPNTPLWDRAVSDRIIEKDDNLLPESREELRKLFYSNPRTATLDKLFWVYSWLWSLKTKLTLHRQD